MNIQKSDLNDIDELAERLVESHSNLLDELVLVRKRKGLTQEVIGERMGINKLAVEEFEHEDSNPTLSSIRRYALAIGVGINYKVDKI